MVRIILTLLMVLWALPVWEAAASDTKLVPYDSLAYRVFNADSTYLYGVSSAGVIQRITQSNGAVSAGKDFTTINANYVISIIYPTSTAGRVFVVVYDSTTNKYYLFLSGDYGANVGNNAPDYNDNDYVLILGDTDGTEANQISSVGILMRGFLEDTVNGQYLIGEYNTNGGRVDGADNDQVRLLKAAAAAPHTWTEVAHWNTDGSHTNVRHIHAVRQNPYNSMIYIAFGDAPANEGGIIAWDGTSALASNQYVSAYSIKADGYVTCDLLFTADFVFWIADQTVDMSTHNGIWRSTHALGSVTRVDTTINGYTQHTGAYGVKTTSGTLIFSEFLLSGYDNPQSNVYVSGDGGATWNVSGVITHSTDFATSAPSSFFESGDYIYFSDYSTAGKTNMTTSKFYLSGSFSDAYPTVLAPLYFVNYGTGTNGAGYGQNSSAPYKTLAYTLDSDRVVNGAHILLQGTTTFVEATTLIDIETDGASRAANGVATIPHIVVSGLGKTVTSMRSTGAYWLYIQANMPIRLEHLAIDIDTTANQNVFFLRTGGILYVRHSRIGSTAADINMTFRFDQAGASATAEYSYFGGDANAVFVNTDEGETATLLSIKDCIIDGFNRGLYLWGQVTSLLVYSNTFYNQATSGVYFGASGYPAALKIKNNIFYTQTSDMTDASGTAESDNDIDYNYFKTALSNIANGGGSHSKTYAINGDIGFVNAAGGDFRLLNGSPAKDTGTDLCSTLVKASDYYGNPVCSGSVFVGRGAGMNMGAAENATGGLFNQFNKTNRFAPHRRLH